MALKPGYARAWGDLGELLTETGRHDEAEEAFREAIRVKPQRIASHRGLGAVLLVRGDNTLAEAAYRRRARPAAGRRAEPLRTVDRDRAAGQAAEAEAAYRAAIEVSPDLAEAHARLGYLLARQGRWRQAEGRYARRSCWIQATREPASPSAPSFGAADAWR